MQYWINKYILFLCTFEMNKYLNQNIQILYTLYVKNVLYLNYIVLLMQVEYLITISDKIVYFNILILTMQWRYL